MNLIKYRNWFFALSLLVIIPGLFALIRWGLILGIDFAGGTLWEIKIEKPSVEINQVKEIFEKNQTPISTISQTEEGTYLARLKVSDEQKITNVKNSLSKQFGNIEDIRLETVGPTISKELTQKALLAIGISILAIVLYVTWSFRKVPKPTSSLAFGVCTIIALVHDVIVVVGIFAILGHFLAIAVDALFITALLTVIGFSVHDTIVVFDRIRENLKKHQGFSFESVVNHSLIQTLGRSLSTSLTVVFVLLAMLLFGGQSTRNFILALLIGIISGTYSSIFNAAPLLVIWQNFRKPKNRQV